MFLIKMFDGIPFVDGVGIACGIHFFDRGTDALNMNAIGVFQPDSLSALNPVISSIRAGKRDAVRQRNGLTTRAFDNSGHHIAFVKYNFAVFCAGPIVLPAKRTLSAGFRGGGCEAQESVSAIDTEYF